MVKNIVSPDRPLTIVKEIKDFIIPLSEEEFSQLEKNIIDEGCRDPLVVWVRDGDLVLIDGHNRYKICQKHKVPFKIKKLSFASFEEVRTWMVDNQMGRRNLTPDQMSYYRGLKYLTLRKKKGGYSNVKSKGSSETSTSEALSEHFNVSESTVKRDAKFAEGLNIIGKSNPKLKTKILTGEVKVKKSDVQTIADAKDPDKIVIRNEADLYNKAKLIKDSIIDEVEINVKKISSERTEAARNVLKSKEPMFLNREDRLRKLKGMIISAMNRAIKESDLNAVKELRRLIEKLTEELL